MGISSMSPGTSSSPISTAWQGCPCRTTRRSPVGSPPAASRGAASTSTPMRPSTGRRPVRVGLSPTEPIVRGGPALASAAQARKKAAEEKSPGTSMTSGSRRAGGSGSLTDQAPPRQPSSTSTPMASSMRSLWSRERRGSRTSNGTPAPTPASRIALLTCALATRPSWRIEVREPPVIRRGRTPGRSR